MFQSFLKMVQGLLEFTVLQMNVGKIFMKLVSIFVVQLEFFFKPKQKEFSFFEGSFASLNIDVLSYTKG